MRCEEARKKTSKKEKKNRIVKWKYSLTIDVQKKNNLILN